MWLDHLSQSLIQFIELSKLSFCVLMSAERNLKLIRCLQKYQQSNHFHCLQCVWNPGLMAMFTFCEEVTDLSEPNSIETLQVKWFVTGSWPRGGFLLQGKSIYLCVCDSVYCEDAFDVKSASCTCCRPIIGFPKYEMLLSYTISTN